MKSEELNLHIFISNCRRECLLHSVEVSSIGILAWVFSPLSGNII